MTVYRVEYDCTNFHEWKVVNQPVIGWVYGYMERDAAHCLNDKYSHFRTRFINVAIAYQKHLSKLCPEVVYIVKEENE